MKSIIFVTQKHRSQTQIVHTALTSTWKHEFSGTNPRFLKTLSLPDGSINLITCRPESSLNSESERDLFVTVCASCGGTQSEQRGG